MQSVSDVFVNTPRPFVGALLETVWVVRISFSLTGKQATCFVWFMRLWRALESQQPALLLLRTLRRTVRCIDCCDEAGV